MTDLPEHNSDEPVIGIGAADSATDETTAKALQDTGLQIDD